MIIPALVSRKRAALLRASVAAVGAVLLASGLRLALDPLAGHLSSFTLYYAVAPFVAWGFGLRAGLVAVALSALVANYGLLAPRGALSLQAPALFASLSFVVIASGLAWLGDRLRRWHDELRAKASDLEREVAERKNAEGKVGRLNALLTQRVEELQAVIHASPIAIAVASDASCEHVWGNQAYARLLDVPQEMNLSKSSHEGERLPYKVYRHGVELLPSELPMQRCTRHGVKVRDLEIEIARADGERRTVLANAAPLHDVAGGIRGCVAVLVDITERKAVERERDEMNRRKDEFLATLAHELRNPLAPLRNVAAIIKQQDHRDQKLQWVSDVVERQVRHMARLVDDLLDLARVTSGLIALKMETVELRALVWQAVELVRPLLEQRKQRLHVELPLEAVRLRVDRVRMIQVIANILTNAAKYSPESGSIQVTASRHPDAVELRIRDFGIGIPAELLPKVFDVFVQGDRSLAPTGGGLGIGLTLAKRLVELHQGTIEVSSAGPGKGTEIALSLPLRPAGADDEEPAPPRDAVVAARKILVVDDNPDVADTLAMLLRAMGHEVRAAYTAEEALSAARRFAPAVALLDIGLPDVDGYTLAARFRADPALRHVCLVALTGYGAESDRARSAAAGFVRHLTKPYPLDQLEALLSDVGPGVEPSAPAAGDRNRSRDDLAVD